MADFIALKNLETSNSAIADVMHKLSFNSMLDNQVFILKTSNSVKISQNGGVSLPSIIDQIKKKQRRHVQK